MVSVKLTPLKASHETLYDTVERRNAKELIQNNFKTKNNMYDEIQSCEICKIQDIFDTAYGVINNKIYCYSCIEKHNLKDTDKLKREEYSKRVKVHFSKFYKYIDEKYKSRDLTIDLWDNDYSYYNKCVDETKSEIAHLYSLIEVKKEDISKSENIENDEDIFKLKNEINLISKKISKHEIFLEELIKTAFHEIENFYLSNKPSLI